MSMTEAIPPKVGEHHGSLKAAGLENFTALEVKREQLVNAPYNPRVMTDEERLKLKGGLAKHGMVEPIVWNAQTGHIIGGHQRIKILDSLMKSKDYTLTVARIDVDEPREKELNILLNNQAAAGSWDLDSLRNLLQDDAVTLEGAGFDHTDIISMFGDGFFDQGRDKDLSDLAEKLSTISEQYSGVQAKNALKAQSESYLVFVFPSGVEVDALVHYLGTAENRYQNGNLLLEKLGIKL